MPTFNIIKKSDIKDTFRTKRIMSDFDVVAEHATEKFTGQIDLPDKWNIGLIVGASGTGKTTIAKELFADCIFNNFDYKNNSVIDDMPKTANVDEIEKMFYAVGFGSVPSWLKPYSVLSNGEKMRVDLARCLLENDKVCFDEFTSVVDRNVAQTTCIAINKVIKSQNKQFIAVSCHYDIIDWLKPDWIFDTNKMQMVFMNAHNVQKNFSSDDVSEMNGENLNVIII